MSGDNTEKEKFAWAGPALFTAVLIGVIAVFWWFL